MAGRVKSIPVAELKLQVMKAISEGERVSDAMVRVGRTVSAYEIGRAHV